MTEEWCFDSDLSTINRNCWQLLRDGVSSYKKPFHFAVLTSIEKNFPSARTVIIRGVDLENKLIRFNTDIRSPKFAQFQYNPNVSWLFYDESLRIQMRCRAVASLHINDAIAEQGWNEAKLNCKITYMSPHPPGTYLNEPYLLDLNQTDVPQEDLRLAKSNFAIVQTKVVSLDWAFLHYKGNRRAFFDYEKNIQTWMQT
jgi:pyridoxamine 5'-phosphate oxidase